MAGYTPAVLRAMATPAQSVPESRPRPHFVHVFPSFGVGGVPLRMARVINHFGARLRHTVISLDDDLEAAQSFAGDLDVRLMAAGRVRRGLVRTLVESASALRRLRPDLLITYNWGAIEWAMANRLRPVARHMHFEAGFGKEEADSQLPHRVMFRRWALARCVKVVVPSRVLEDFAHRVWKLPAEQIAYIPNGVDVGRFADPVRELAVGLFLAKAGLEMHVAGDGSQAVSHRPFDSTPVVGNQQIGTQPSQRCSTLD